MESMLVGKYAYSKNAFGPGEFLGLIVDAFGGTSTNGMNFFYNVVTLRDHDVNIYDATSIYISDHRV